MKHLKNFESLFNDFFKSKEKNVTKEVNSKIKVEKYNGLNHNDIIYNVYIIKDNKDCFKIGEIKKKGNYWANYLFIDRTNKRNKDMSGFISPTKEQLDIINTELSSKYNDNKTYRDFLNKKFGIII